MGERGGRERVRGKRGRGKGTFESQYKKQATSKNRRKMLACPASMKKVKPFLRLAHDLKSEGSAETRVIAYYCEKHAVEVALPLLQALQQQGAADPPQAFVLQLMDLVEADKAQLGDAFSDELQSRKLVGNYALKVFKKADDEDRAGLSNKGTARTYLVAVRLLKAMSQFADDPSDEKHYDQILKYAMVKAASIMRAIKAGVRPTPGPPSSGEGDAMISGDFFLLHYL